MSEINYEGWVVKSATDKEVVLVPPENPEQGVWEPKLEDDYWHVDKDGDVLWDTWVNDTLDRSRLALGNCYPTRGLAHKAATMMKRNNNIVRACLLVDPDFEPDWSDIGQFKFHPRINSVGFWTFSFSLRDVGKTAYVSTEEKAKQVCELLTKWGIK